MSEAELGGFGDARLRRLGATLLAALPETPTMCRQALSRDRKQALAFGRFLDNGAVSADEMLVHAGELTGQRAAGRHVLAIEDTPELPFAGHAASKRGFGTAGNGRDIGLFLHPTIAVDAARGGVIDPGGARPLRHRGAAARQIAAVRVMQIVIGRDGSTGQRLGDAAGPADPAMLRSFNARLQGRTAALKNPHQPDRLAWFAWIIGRLGGRSGYTSKGDTPPGPKTIARGLAKPDAMAEGWRLAHSADVQLP